ncbi:hypothetical protein ALC60_04118, partial [Trachymyrmex zeteki]
KKYFILPFLSNITNTITSFINKLIVTTGYRCLNKLNSFIKVHKDRVNKTSNQNVVYKINCNDCNASYVGQTRETATAATNYYPGIQRLHN